MSKDLKEISAILQKAEKLSIKNPTLAIELCEKCDKNLLVANQLAELHKILGNSLRNLSNYSVAIQNYLKSLKIFRREKDELNTSKVHNNLGNVYSILGDYPKAVENYLMALKFYEKKNLKELVASTKGNLGNTYLSLGNFEKAIEYFEESLQTEDLIQKSRVYDGLGNTYLKMGEIEKSLEFFNLGLRITEKLKIEPGILSFTSNIATAYHKQNAFEKAISRHLKVLKSSKKLNLLSAEFISLLELGKVYLKKLDLDLSIKYFQNSLKVAQKMNSLAALEEAYNGLYLVFKEKNDFSEALAFCEKSQEVGKKLYTENSDRRLKNLRISYEVEKKELQIQKLETETKLKEKELTNFVLNLSQKNSFIKKIQNDLEEITNLHFSKNALRKFVNELRKEVGTEEIREFESHFNKIHSDFFKRLTQLSTELTPRQLQICALIKSNLSSKEIGSLLYIAERSVDKQRSRIRQKLKLSTEQNLTSYLASL